MKGNEKTHIQPLTTREKETAPSQSSHKILSTSNCGYTDKKKDVNMRALSEKMRLLKAFTCNFRPPFTSF